MKKLLWCLVLVALPGACGNERESGADLEAVGRSATATVPSVAREQGFIVVYPNGIEREWNYVRGFLDWEYVDIHAGEVIWEFFSRYALP